MTQAAEIERLEYLSGPINALMSSRLSRKTQFQIRELLIRLLEDKIPLEVKLGDEQDFSGQDLSKVDFSVRFPDKSLPYANFVAASLTGVDLRRFDLRFSDFSGVNA